MSTSNLELLLGVAVHLAMRDDTDQSQQWADHYGLTEEAARNKFVWTYRRVFHCRRGFNVC